MDTDIDENGQPIKANEPKVSKLTGKRRKGQPKAITKHKISEICGIIRAGNYVKQSVLACGVNYHTFQDYMKKGKKGIRPYDEYYEMVEQAKAGAEIDMSTRINDSAEAGNVGADMWKLSRMFPNRWGQTKRVEAKVDNSQTIEIVRLSDIEKDKKE